ncbi:MAG TPA: CehA/McbA family metallohydrolase [Phototrophicaceae bacterium]|nr:CehA/McbA family metallohydrolase [Phototrophicaceae bacterium]
MNLQLTGNINPLQFQRHLEIPFTVPPDLAYLTINFEYTPAETDGFNNLLTLTIFDPTGWRGEGHRHAPRQQINLSAAQATPGYLPGALPPGHWLLVINTHMVLEPITYHLTILEAAGDTEGTAPVWKSRRMTPPGPGWYRGDLHAHTIHSDGHWAVPDLVDYARAAGLDFVTLSDHNTIAGLAQLDSLSSNGLLTLGGVELTTFFGHALVLGLRHMVDWRVRPGQRSMSAICNEVTAAGGTFIIAHPHSLGNPLCTGCDWQYADMQPGPARLVEIWNGYWDAPGDQNEKGVQQWYHWLNDGWRMIATAGSDIHESPQIAASYGRNVVYAPERTERAILDAIRQGRLYLSQGPHLELSGSTPDGQRAVMGETLVGHGAELTAVWSDAPADSRVCWIIDGEPQPAMFCDSAGDIHLTREQIHWAVVEMRAADNQLLAITNPIFIGENWR